MIGRDWHHIGQTASPVPQARRRDRHAARISLLGAGRTSRAHETRASDSRASDGSRRLRARRRPGSSHGRPDGEIDGRMGAAYVSLGGA